MVRDGTRMPRLVSSAPVRLPVATGCSSDRPGARGARHRMPPPHCSAMLGFSLGPHGQVAPMSQSLVTAANLLDCFVCGKHRGDTPEPGGAIYDDALVRAGHRP